MKIEVGGGRLCPQGFTNLDPIHGEGAFKRRAQDGRWPADDNTVERVGASHVMEHIPAGDERLFVLNEAWRVLQPGAVLEIEVPVLKTMGLPPDAGIVSWESLADPTHVSFWVYESFLYLIEGGWAANAQYDLRLWRRDSIDTYRENGSIAHIELIKP